MNINIKYINNYIKYINVYIDICKLMYYLYDEYLKDMDLSNIMEAVSECLDEEIEGDFVNVEGADGTVVRVFVDK